MYDLFFDGYASVFSVPAMLATFFLGIKFVLMMTGGSEDGSEIDADGVDIDVDADVDVDAGDIDADAAEIDHDSAEFTSKSHSHNKQARPSGFKLLTTMTLAAAIMGGGFAGLATFRSTGDNLFAAIIAAGIFGFIFMFTFAWLMRFIFTLSEHGTITVGDALYETAVVYISVPGKRGGGGEVKVLVNGRIRYFRAETDEETIPSGEEVYIIDDQPADGLVIVARKD